MDYRQDDGHEFDTKSVGSTVSEAPTGISTLSSRIASLAVGFEDRLRPGIAEADEYASQTEEDAGSEEEIVELSEEQLLQELDNQEPAFQVCSRLFYENSLVPGKRLSIEQLQTFQHQGYVVVDDLISQEAASRLHDDAVHLRRDGRLLAPNPPPQGREDAARMADPTARGDQILWLHPGQGPATAPSIAHLYTIFQELQEDLLSFMHLQPSTPEVQLSIYPPHGAQYVRHRDAFPDDGSESGMRRVTAIVYANPRWQSADGGKLRLWPPPVQPAPGNALPSSAVPKAHHEMNGHSNGHSVPTEGSESESADDTTTDQLSTIVLPSSMHASSALGDARVSQSLTEASQLGQSPRGSAHAASHPLTPLAADSTSQDGSAYPASSSATADGAPYPPPGRTLGAPPGLSHADQAQPSLPNGLHHTDPARGLGSGPGSLDLADSAALPQAHQHSRQEAAAEAALNPKPDRGHQGPSQASSVSSKSEPHAQADTVLSYMGHNRHPMGSDASGPAGPGSMAREVELARQRGASGQQRTEPGVDAVVDVAPLAGRLVLFLSGAVEHAVLPTKAERVAVTAWFQ